MVLVDPCGFGSLGDPMGDAFGMFDLPSYDFRVHEVQPIDVAFNINRSVVGVHAGDVVRAAETVASGLLPGVAPMRVVATLSANDTAPAVLSAALATSRAGVGGPGPLGKVGIVGSTASWAAIVQAARYDMANYYSFVFGALNHFDLPDMAAALPAGIPVMFAGPTDVLGVPLAAAASDAVFGWAQRANPALAVVPTSNAARLTQAIVHFIRQKEG